MAHSTLQRRIHSSRLLHLILGEIRISKMDQMMIHTNRTEGSLLDQEVH